MIHEQSVARQQTIIYQQHLQRKATTKEFFIHSVVYLFTGFSFLFILFTILRQLMKICTNDLLVSDMIAESVE